MMQKKQQSEVGTIHYMKISQKIKSFRDDINSFITFAIHDICLNYSVVSQQIWSANKKSLKFEDFLSLIKIKNLSKFVKILIS